MTNFYVILTFIDSAEVLEIEYCVAPFIIC
jgi:hypothetical protein